MVAALADCAGETTRLGAGYAVLQNVGNAENAGQRGADFMAQKGKETRFLARDVQRAGLGRSKPLAGGLHGTGALGIFLRNDRKNGSRAGKAAIAPVVNDDHTVRQRRRVPVCGQLGDQRNGCTCFDHYRMRRHEIGDAAGGVYIPAAGARHDFAQPATCDMAQGSAIDDDGQGKKRGI